MMINLFTWHFKIGEPDVISDLVYFTLLKCVFEELNEHVQSSLDICTIIYTCLGGEKIPKCLILERGSICVSGLTMVLAQGRP